MHQSIATSTCQPEAVSMLGCTAVTSETRLGARELVLAIVDPATTIIKLREGSIAHHRNPLTPRTTSYVGPIPT
jgi:hypothetical protein